jgi:hypothetical protein
MRDIRARIAQQHGIELTDHQIQELAARRLEAILDVRSMNPQLMDQLRRSAGATTVAVPSITLEPPYQFDESSLYASRGGVMRFVRRLLNPVLRLFLNPDPLIHALRLQAQLNAESARRDAERSQRQMEWNALHYEIVRRLMAEVSKVSLEAQSLGLRIESLSAKVDFNDRRVRGIEGAVHESALKAVPAGPAAPRAQDDTLSTNAVDTPTVAEGPRRRRRRRRGRRSSFPSDSGAIAPSGTERGAVTHDDDAVLDAEAADPVPVVATTEGSVLERASPEPIAESGMEPTSAGGRPAGHEFDQGVGPKPDDN